jgi:NhaP-type Na+/H+ or K+/H+ antiporter
VIDIIFGSLGITGLILAGSLLLGLLLGILIIWVRKRIEAREPAHAPSSAYGFTPSTVAHAQEPDRQEQGGA